MQTIITDYPPLFDTIAEALPAARNKGVIFSWGGCIYNPSRIIIPPELFAHEALHGKRQGSTDPKIREWWFRYIDDPKFRFEEELPAHIEEYRWFLDYGNRQQRRAALKHVASRLSSPLYGGLVSPKKAKELLSKHTKHTNAILDRIARPGL